MKHVIRHHLDTPTAKQVIARAFEEYRQRYARYDPTIAWVNDHEAEVGFSAKGVSLRGGLAVGERQITLELGVPLLLRPFQSRAVEVIDREVRRWIERAESDGLR